MVSRFLLRLFSVLSEPLGFTNFSFLLSNSYAQRLNIHLLVCPSGTHERNPIVLDPCECTESPYNPTTLPILQSSLHEYNLSPLLKQKYKMEV